VVARLSTSLAGAADAARCDPGTARMSVAILNSVLVTYARIRLAMYCAHWVSQLFGGLRSG